MAAGASRSSCRDYTFAVRDADGELQNVGKAYSGVTDAEIAELTEFLKAHTLEDYGHFRTVEPLVILEVAFNNVMRSGPACERVCAAISADPADPHGQAAERDRHGGAGGGGVPVPGGQAGGWPECGAIDTARDRDVSGTRLRDAVKAVSDCAVCGGRCRRTESRPVPTSARDSGSGVTVGGVTETLESKMRESSL